MYDLVVIGGGANGAGVARDAALRGLSVALCEREDWGAGTTGHSTRMIHGGLRYLLYDVPTTRISSEDAGRIRKIAPHLTFRIPFLWPIYAGEGLFGEAKEALLAAYDTSAPAKHGLHHVRLDATEARRLEPGLAPGIAGALTLDEWGIDVYRLSALNALDARAAGAHLFAHTEVEELHRRGDGRTVTGVRARDRLDGRVLELEARLVVNAAGPWAPFVAAMADASAPLRPGKGVHVTFERRIGNFGLILEAVDGRLMFLVPHGAETIAGTTDTEFYGDPARADLEVTADDVAYVIEACARALPQARAWRPLRAWAGVRNTVFEWGTPADDLSRKHEIVDHETNDGIAGLISILGGKLASYRLQAREAVDLAQRKLGRPPTPDTTASRALPGADGAMPEPDFVALAREIPLPAWALALVWRRLGSLIHEVSRDAGPDDVAPICRAEALTPAEIRWAIRVEGCRTLEDLRRHAHLAAGGCDGLDCAVPAAHHAAELLGWTPAQTRLELASFLDRRWAERRPVLTGANLAQEELQRWASE